ncbi:MAG TPA: thioester domain-containing protein [Actinophytocola sp.]|uniref:thioester domain-containing protein n=1 Tax=Actinophytocola sp. TaxID=1872138 RepID=UPI002DDD279B|nr:thioester domain-containing protein [Actinophytocola sp.]HEV2782323.1 thioester domain-containing protein [Actinophytocola sp.]
MGSRVKRGLTVLTGASVAVLVGALPASAEPATGKVEGGSADGYHVNLGGSRDNLRTSLIGFKLDDGTSLKVYCVEINTNIDRDATMVEVPWDKYPNPDSPFREHNDKINWVLHHGFPVVDEAALEKKLADKGVTLHGGLSEKEAITATQAAAWHFSDETDLDEDNPLPDGDADADADVLALYAYLTGPDNVGMGNHPTPTLQINPETAKGEAGKRVGPFTVSTTGEIVELKATAPEGVTLTDKDGKEVTPESIKNGTEVFFTVPADAEAGEGSFELTASAHVATGRLFVGENYADKPTQSLIVAQSDKSTLSASAKATWTAAAVTPPTTTSTTTTTAPPTTTTTPAPQARNTGGLASTGASIFVPVVLGLVLLGAGTGALLFLRRRRRA